MAESIEFEHFIGLNTLPKGALFHPDGKKFIFSSGGNVIVADLIDQHSQEFLRAHDDNITCLSVSKTGKYIASGQCGSNSDVVIWDYETRDKVYRFEEHDISIVAVAFSDDERVFASIGHNEDGKLLMWDLSNGCIIASAKLPPGTCCVTFGGFVKDIKRRDTSHYLLCTAGTDGLMLWDLDPYSGDVIPQKLTGETRATITREITDISFSMDREFLYGATTSGDYVIASIRSLKIAQAVQATKQQLHSILPYRDGVVIGCGDHTIKVYNGNGDFIGQVRLDGAVVCLSPSPDRLEVLASTSNGSVARVNLNTLQYILLSESHTQSVVKVEFDQGQNERFATASADGSIKVWDLVEYTVIATAYARREQERGASPQCLAFADILFSGWSDGKVLAHSAETGDNLWMLPNAHPGGVTALVLSHNRRFILTGGPSGEVRLWELRSRELVSHLKEHKQTVTAIALFEDDTLGVSGSRDRCMLRWDLKSEIRVHCHMQRMGGINDLAITKDQRHTVSVGQDKRIVIWDNRHNDPVGFHYLDGESDEGLSIAISHDGTMIATAGSAGVVRMWALHESNSNNNNNNALGPHSQQGDMPMQLQMVCEGRGHSRAIRSVAFSKDDKQIVSVGEDGGIFVWSVYAL